MLRMVEQWGGSESGSLLTVVSVCLCVCVCVCAQSLSHVHLCNPMDYSPPDSSVHGIFQARILEWGCHLLLQGSFLTQGLDPCLCISCTGRQILPTELPGKPKVLLSGESLVMWSQIWGENGLGEKVIGLWVYFEHRFQRFLLIPSIENTNGINIESERKGLRMTPGAYPEWEERVAIIWAEEE